MAPGMTIESESSLSLYRLLTWLSPAFPVGGFAYSGGLERAIHDGLVKDASGLADWLDDLMHRGPIWNDCVLLAQAHRAFDEAAGLAEVAELAEALAGTAERHFETMALGAAFIAAATAWPHPVLASLGGRAAYPVAIGAISAAHHVGLEAALVAFLGAAGSQMVSVAIRSGILGQKQGVALIAGLEAAIVNQAKRAAASSIDALGSGTVHAEIESMKHEVQQSRLFRS